MSNGTGIKSRFPLQDLLTSLKEQLEDSKSQPCFSEGAEEYQRGVEDTLEDVIKRLGEAIYD